MVCGEYAQHKDTQTSVLYNGSETPKVSPVPSRGGSGPRLFTGLTQVHIKPHLDQFIRFLRGLRLCPTCLDRPQYIINNRPHVVLCTARWLSSKNYTHTHPFNGHLSATTRLTWYQKGKTNLDFTEARDSKWQ